MSLLVALIIGFAFFIFFNTIFGGNKDTDSPTSYTPNNMTQKDIERLREIADYDRWENGGSKNSTTDL